MTKRTPTMKTLAPPPAPAAVQPSLNQAQPDRSPLIARLVAYRKKHDLTQKEIAARLEFNFNTYKTYEMGTRVPNGPRTQRILALLGDLKK